MLHVYYKSNRSKGKQKIWEFYFINLKIDILSLNEEY